MPAQFRKKPVVIEAIQHTSLREDCMAILDWCGEPWEMDGSAFIIPTLEGPMRCEVGWWVIRGVKGEFYPCDPIVFLLSYDPVM